MEVVNENKALKNVMRIIKGTAISLVITLILLLLFAVLLTVTSIQENTIKPVIIIITAISILIGSSISTLKIKKNGMLNGGLVGFTYIVTMYILSSITTGFNLNLYSIIIIVVSIIAGIIGGIIGVNL